MLSDKTWENVFQYALTALEKHSIKDQLKKTAEELCELQHEVFKAMKRPEDADIDHIAEEMGDVLIMLMQLKIMLEIPGAEISDWIEYKINRETKGPLV